MLQVKSTARVAGIIWVISIATLVAHCQTPLYSEEISLGAPKVIRFKGFLKDNSGQPLTGEANVRFAIYDDAVGGSPIWQETQNVTFSDGYYSVMLGLGSPAGIPSEIFRSAKACWLGVRLQLNGENEQQRTFLASVPYALKATDADTLGGFPASAFIRRPTPHAQNSAGSPLNGSNPNNPELEQTQTIQNENVSGVRNNAVLQQPSAQQTISGFGLVLAPSAPLIANAPVTFNSGGSLSGGFTITCKTLENIRCVSAGNNQHWSGMTADEWINAAIVDLIRNSPTGSGEIWIGPGLYNLANQVRISTSNIKLRCLGPSVSFGNGPSCTLRWTGAHGGTMMLLDTAHPAEGGLSGDSVVGFYFNGNNSAHTCLELLSVEGGEFSDNQCSNFAAAPNTGGFHIAIDPAITGASGLTSLNRFINNQICCAAANANGVWISGTSTYDVSGNTWIGNSASASGTGEAWRIENSDNDYYFKINAACGAKGECLHLTCMSNASSQNMCARELIFIGTNLGPRGVVQDGREAYYATSNRFYGYEICNGSPTPSTSLIRKGSAYIDILDCGDHSFGTFEFGTVSDGTSVLTSRRNYSKGSAWSLPLQAMGKVPSVRGSGACSTITKLKGGAWAGQFACIGETGRSTVVITPGMKAPNGYSCWANDLTTGSNVLRQSSVEPTSCTISGTINADDVVTFGAIAY